MVVNTLGNLLTITFRVKEFIFGLINEGMKEIGKLIRWMVGEYSHGLMAENTRENTLTIKSQGMEFLPGQIIGDMKAVGKMENSMEKEHI